tara:strand:- start:1029 stop:1262 length:234 start_codon:yes stop_codon:yes gene_type:complete
MRNYPKEYYAKEDKLIHKAGYTMSLLLMGVGLLESAHSLPYIIKGESKFSSMILGPVVIISGGIAAYSYLKDAEIIY